MTTKEISTRWVVLTRNGRFDFPDSTAAFARMAALRDQGVGSRLYKVAPVLEASMRPRKAAKP